MRRGRGVEVMVPMLREGVRWEISVFLQKKGDKGRGGEGKGRDRGETLVDDLLMYVINYMT